MIVQYVASQLSSSPVINNRRGKKPTVETRGERHREVHVYESNSCSLCLQKTVSRVSTNMSTTFNKSIGRM
ncbi:hypothetical protein MHYP_G00180700 [Metynnis hypsauchen]